MNKNDDEQIGREVMEQQLQQATNFFKNEQAYEKLFILFKKKYESLGRIGGTVSIIEFTDTELEVIGSFFSMPSSQLYAKGSVSLRLFEQQLVNTRFHKLGLKQLLDAYFNQVIIYKKQERKEREEKLYSCLIVQQKRHPELNIRFDFM